MSLTIRPMPGEGIMETFGRVAAELQGTAILHMTVFGLVRANEAAMEALKRTFGKLDFPVTWVDGGACDGGLIAGIQVSGLAGGKVQRLRLDGRVIGSAFQSGGARHSLVGGLGPSQHSSSRADQTKQTLERLAAALAQAGFSIAHVVRTWFYLDDILSWYDEFNRARTQAYSGIKFRSGSLPASTGIGARNPSGAALMVAARALLPLNSSARAVEIASPLQCPAPAYGSSFSRAMEISTDAGRKLFISGTASIAPNGATMWPNDVGRQVELTMTVVEAILKSRRLSFSDLSRAVAYFKHPGDIRAFQVWCAWHELDSLPVVPALCAICRGDLAFEIEADAEDSRSVRDQL